MCFMYLVNNGLRCLNISKSFHPCHFLWCASSEDSGKMAKKYKKSLYFKPLRCCFNMMMNVKMPTTVGIWHFDFNIYGQDIFHDLLSIKKFHNFDCCCV